MTVHPTVSLADTLAEIRFAMATDARDWSRSHGDAFLWSVLVGWECEEAHEHDELCSADTLGAVAHRHGWRPERVEQVRAMRRAVQLAVEPEPDKDGTS